MPARNNSDTLQQVLDFDSEDNPYYDSLRFKVEDTTEHSVAGSKRRRSSENVDVQNGLNTLSSAAVSLRTEPADRKAAAPKKRKYCRFPRYDPPTQSRSCIWELTHIVWDR